MQDLKTGHLLGAAPNAQFWGQVVGSTVGAVVSALIYRLYVTWVSALKMAIVRTLGWPLTLRRLTTSI